MEWRIRESGHGGFVVEKGLQTEKCTPAPTGIGFIMPAFIVYESTHFDTRKQAEHYISRQRVAGR